MDSKLCVDCIWCHSGIINLFRVGALHGCSHPEVANPVNGNPKRSCAEVRQSWREECRNGRWFVQKSTQRRV